MKKTDNLLNNIEINDEFLKYLKEFVTPQRVERFEQVIARRLAHLHLALEDIFQGHNASAVLRTSEALGIQNVYVIEKNNQFVPNDEIALGAEKWINIHHFKGENSINECIAEMKSKGIRIYATSPHYDGYTPANVPIDQPLAILFGTEKDGLSKEALDTCDGFLQIPMYGLTESFNISVSAAICMSEIVQRVRQDETNAVYNKKEQQNMLASWILKTVASPEGIVERWKDR